MKTAWIPFVTAPMLLACSGAVADQYDPPAGYYSTATGTGATLKSNLHLIISQDYWVPGSTTHRVLSYSAQVPIPLAICARLSESPSSPSQILVYNDQVSQKNWDNGLTWNREHTWPQSRGVSSTGPDFSDIHMLRPCNSALNSSRSNKPYGTTGTEFDPNQVVGARYRGECARALFYADTRYDGGEVDTTDLTLVVGSPSGNQMGDLDETLAWHYDEGPDSRERRRNHLIWNNDPWVWEDTQINPEITLPGFERPPLPYHQGNRNPYIDHPEYVWAIWGSGPNNATVYVGGGPAGDGSSSTSIDLGRAIIGSTITSTVPLNRNGTHPTTWIVVSVSGNAVSDDEGIPGTYPYVVSPPSIPQPIVSVGIDTSLGSVGVQNGTVVVDNTDLTTAGAGQGSADVDDTINVEADAVDHSNGSFDSVSDADAVIIDFGSVAQNSSEPQANASLWNLQSVLGDTADLDVDSVIGSGHTGVVSINLGPSTGLDASLALGFQAAVNTASAPGAYESIYTVTVSDENIPGATTQSPLLVTVRATIVPACAGDVTGDGQTNIADFNIVAGNFGAGPGMTRAQGDLSGDGFVNIADFNILAGDFGCN